MAGKERGREGRKSRGRKSGEGKEEMTTQHTPGPWSTWNADIYASTKDGFFRIATADGLQSTPANDAKNNDNARLIAAAPDLLSACEAVWDSCDTEGRIMLPANGTTITELRSAIRKAKGEPDR